ncbi:MULTISPECIES: hypothetical protein [Rhodococcus erythropolis group]|uniref:hypothetical protein n=1 Tax=Rhodococcus erythropolis TaxID=1833 RepID=UPI001E4B126B|nr:MULTISPECIES: hypothetical protein [Rhodococcus erythropolis group]
MRLLSHTLINMFAVPVVATDNRVSGQRVPAVVAGNVAPLDYDDKVGFALTYTDFLNKLTDITRTLK